MASEVVQAPISLLLSPDIQAPAKLIWMVSRLRPSSNQAANKDANKDANQADLAWLSETSGLSRPTVLKWLAQLVASGWDPTRAGDPGATARPTATATAKATATATVPVPRDILINRGLGVHARVMYGLLLLTPGFRHPCGQFTYAELAALAHASPNTVTRAVNELARAEWVKVERANRLARIHFELSFPGLARALMALAGAQKRLDQAKYFGEGLMREYLSLLIDSEDYEDDATPGFLVNPRTDERLQFDRYYPPSVAFEFNGPQHYRATEKFTAEEADQQRERDYIKLGICVTRGITLVVIHPENLTLKGMRQKVENLLPPRNQTGYDLLIDFLESESRGYRRFVSRL